MWETEDEKASRQREEERRRKLGWLTAEEVLAKYAFIPGNPERSTIRSKLVSSREGWIRLWLEEDIKEGKR